MSRESLKDFLFKHWVKAAGTGLVLFACNTVIKANDTQDEKIDRLERAQERLIRVEEKLDAVRAAIDRMERRQR
jgi:hypothetical protein